MNINHAESNCSNNKYFKKHKKNHPYIINKITIAAICTSISIIFSFLSSDTPLGFSPLPITYLRINIAVVFLIIIFLITNFYFAVVANFISSLSAFTGGPVAFLASFLSNMSYLIILYWFNLFFLKVFDNIKKKNDNDNDYRKIFLICFPEIFSTIFISIFLAFLNGILITPLYWYSYEFINSPSFIEAMYNWKNDFITSLRSKTFQAFSFIDNYWQVIFIVYISFNLINFSICSIIVVNFKIILLKIKNKDGFLNKNLGGILWRI
ncbi:MAG: MPN527 family putative ECF transporter permease subunit [Mycoplasmoidaceae bacterium]